VASCSPNISQTNWKALYANSNGEVLLTLIRFIGPVGLRCVRPKRMVVWGSEVLELLIKLSLPRKVGELSLNTTL
jgi:hypothetical protein